MPPQEQIHTFVRLIARKSCVNVKPGSTKSGPTSATVSA
jgi:hypothetical protein